MPLTTIGSPDTADSYGSGSLGKKRDCDYCGKKKTIYGNLTKRTDGNRPEFKNICKDCLKKKEL